MARAAEWKPARGAQIYRRISVQMHSDEKYMALSPAKPSGRSLWEYLQHGPHTGVIPGLARIGRAAMAEELGWDQGEFDACFAEIEQLGMARWDFGARLLFLPNALRHNLPTSPNVVLSWAAHWSLLPECDLKIAAHECLKAIIKQELSEAFAAAFDRACPKPKLKASGKPSVKASEKPSDKATDNACDNQEQEQEQDILRIPSGIRSAAAAIPTSGANDDSAAGAEDKFWRLAPEAERGGISRSRMGELAKVVNGDFLEALRILEGALGKKKPGDYLGGVMRRMKSENSPPVIAIDPNIPPWVTQRRLAGAIITQRASGRWECGGSLFNDAGECIGF